MAPRRSTPISPSRPSSSSASQNGLPLKAYEVQKNYIKAVGKGLLKVMSKMGISTYQSYCGAQIFDAVGLHSGFVEKYFTGTATTIEGAGWAEIAEETVRRHRDAYGDNPIYRTMLDVGGDYAFRLRGEDHAWTPRHRSPGCSMRCAATRRTNTRPSPRRSTSRASGC